MKGHFWGEETSTMKEHFIMKSFIRKRELWKNSFIRKPSSILQRGIFDEKMDLLGKERSTIIRKRKVYCIEGVFDERAFFLWRRNQRKLYYEKTISLGKENSFV